MLNDPKRVKEIFLEAAEQPDEAARAAYVDNACRGDAELRARVEALLRSHDPSGSFLGTPAAVLPDANQTSEHDSSGRGNGPTNSDPENESADFHFLQPSTRADSLGRIGHYEMLQVLGKGGFGIVFRAFDDNLQRVVAVKVMAASIAATSPARKRFLREARSSAQIRHENVVQVYEVGEQPLPYLVMEFIPGETLQQKLNRTGPLEVLEVMRIGQQVAEGLAAAHASELIHRDIKPGNILLEGGTQKAKITDFGLARAADDASTTQSGVIAGTPNFMAPEQALGRHIDQRADLFSLGSVLYQMVSGRPPFRAPSALAVLKRVAEEPPRPIPQIIPETPDWLCGIIAKLQAKNPDDRFQSAREVADLLAECEATLKARRDVANILPANVQPPVPPAPTAPGGRKWAAAAAVVILAVIALTVTELAGVTDLFRQQSTPDALQTGGAIAPLLVAKPESPPPIYKNHLGMEFVLVPKGKSWLGGGNDNPGGKEEVIPDDIYLGKYEVTQEEWDKVMGENPSHFSRTGGGSNTVKDISDADLKRFPVESVSWDQCQNFVASLNKLEKETGWVYRLPTEVEWEYACRGGPMANPAESEFDFYLDAPSNTLLTGQANFQNDLGRTCKVGSYAPNHLGLYDMHGNIAEWCHDLEYEGAAQRVFKGMSWRSSAEECRAAHRAGHPATFQNLFHGLRLARVPATAALPEVKAPTPEAPEVTEAPSIHDAWLRAVAIVPLDEHRAALAAKMKQQLAGFDDAYLKAIPAVPARRQRVMADVWLKERRPAFAGWEGAWLKAIPSMAAETQVIVVAAWLKERNPGFDSAVTHMIEDGVVTNLEAPSSFVQDLTPLRALTQLRTLTCRSTVGHDLQAENDAAVLGSLKSLETVNGKPVTQLLKEIAARNAEFQEWLRLVPELNAEQQVRAVSAKLKERNPGFDGNVAHKIEDSVVTEIGVVTDHVTDISPLRAFSGLRVLDCSGTQTSGGQLADLMPLKGMNLAGLTILDLAWTKLGDAGLTQFKDCKNLTALNLSSTQVTDAGLAHFNDCKNLLFLQIAETRTGDAGLAYFKDCKKLTVLELANTQVTDAGLANFKDCNDLTHLSLWLTQVGDAGLAHFKDCKNLTVLDLNNTQVGDAGLASFQDCENLKHLVLRNTQVTDAGLAYFKNCKNLTLLNLAGTKVTDVGLAHFKECKNLTHLAVDDCHQITDVGLAYFEGCKNLTLLDLRNTQVTDAGLACFKDCKNLTAINLSGTQVSDAGLAHFAGLDRLTQLYLTQTQVTDAGLAHLEDCNDLTHLAVDNCDRITDAGLAHLEDCKNLTFLVLQNTQVTDAGLTHLKDCTHLTTLNLSGTQVTDSGLAHLAGLDRLTQLYLTGTNVTDAGLAHFQDCKNLTVLTLDSCPQITDAGLAYFKDCKMLTQLGLHSTQATNAGLAHFQDCKNLTILELRNTQVTDLSPLIGMSLQVLWCDFHPERDAKILRAIPTLKTINGERAEESWKSLEK